MINYVTAKPEVGGDTNGFLNASAAEYGQYELEGAVGFSLSETTAVRLSGTYQTLDGYFENVNPNTQGDSDTGGYDWLALRAQLAWEPSEDFSARLALSYSDLDGEDAVHKALGLGAFPFDFGFSCGDPAIGTLGTSCVNLLGGVATDDAYETQQAHDGFQKMELFQAALFLDYAFESAALSIVLASQTNERQFFNESDGAAQGVLAAHFDDEHEQISLEARLSSTGAGPWDWVVGAYYYEDELEYFRSNYILAFGGTSAGRFNRIEAKNIAIFGEVGYEFSERLKVIAGLRFTDDEREGAIVAGSIVPNPTLGDTHLDRDTWFGLPGSIVSDLSGQKESWTEPSARFSIQYAATEEVNLWFTASHGFRGGDFNGGALLEDEFEVTDPEFITNYELGIKGRYLDNAMTLNASIFYYDYEDKIGFVEIPGARGDLGSISLLANFGDVEGQGGEIELDWQLTDSLNVRSSLAYVDAEFVSTNFDLGFGGGNITGNQPAKTPELSWNTFVTHTTSLSNGGELRFMVNGNWQDDQFFTDVNRGYEAQDAYWVWNASVAYTSPDDRWTARLWGKNLDDEEWFTDGFTFVAEHLALPGGPPRQFGATLNYRF